ncbi:Kinesin-like protein KIN-14M [Glycine max]|nr:Kinesin-like protein KIN-14M [Glycine max]
MKSSDTSPQHDDYLLHKSISVDGYTYTNTDKEITAKGTGKSSNFTHRIHNHVKMGPNLSEILKGKLSLGARIIQEGGRRNIFKSVFGMQEKELLLKASQCYLYTTAGPIAGILFVSTAKVAFYSERPITFSSVTGELVRAPYKEKCSFKDNQIKALEEQLPTAEKKLQVSNISAYETRTEYEGQQKFVNELQRGLADAEYKLIEGERLRKKLHNTILELKGNIRVFCRVRPLLADESCSTEDKIFSYPTSMETSGRAIDLAQNGLSTGSPMCASMTSDGKHILSACDDCNVYLWNVSQEESNPLKAKKITSCERFFSNASVAVPWHGLKSQNIEIEHQLDALDKTSSQVIQLSPPASFSLSQEFFLESFPKGSATWPEEKLPVSSPKAKASVMRKSEYKFFKSSCKSTSSAHAWGMVIVTAGWNGRIKSFHNYGLPIPA